MGRWLAQNRAAAYLLVNAVIALAASIGWGASSAPVSLLGYVLVLFALCSAPILWLDSLNGRVALLAIFMGIYFLLFGALDLQVLLTGGAPAIARTETSMSLAQIAVLLGALCTIAGYIFAARLAAPSVTTDASSDWSDGAVLLTGSACFLLGTTAMAYLSLFAVVENSGHANEKGFDAMGPLLTFAVMLGQMIQPLGVVILAYGYAKFRTLPWLALIVALVFIQFVLGFLTDTKGTSLLGILLVAVTQSLWDGKVSKAWVIGVVVFATLLFPILQANRVVRDERGFNRQQALEHIDLVVQAAIEARDKVYEERGGQRAQTFLERTSGENALELLFEHVGVDKPFLNGRTLIALPYAFVPRLILPDKEDVEVGQLYNQTFLHGSKNDFTYISVSELGELYWNFGWPGVIIGSILGGALLGLIGAKSALADARSLTRLLILLVTIKVLCLGYGGSISLSYVVWLRSMAAIGLLHLMFSRLQSAPSNQADYAMRAAIPSPQTPIRYPNLMR